MSASSPVAYDANVLLAAVTALSAAIAFVAALHLYARCLLRRRVAGAGAGAPATLTRCAPGDPGRQLRARGDQRRGVRAGGRRPDAKQLARCRCSRGVFFSATAAADAAVQCAVCLGEMVDGELGRLLPACRHVFHAECIDTWLAVSSTCPVCRAAVGAAEDDEPAAAPVAGVSPAS